VIELCGHLLIARVMLAELIKHHWQAQILRSVGEFFIGPEPTLD
jgi:hypothetical protein